MPVVNTTSPTRVAVGAAQLAVEARAVLQQHVSVAALAHRTSFWTALNSGVPARSEQLEQRALDGADDGAGALQALQAAVVVDLVARADGVGGDVDFDAAVEQVVDGLADADVRLDPADDRLVAPVEVKAVGARGGEDGLLDARLVLEAELGRGVAEAFGVLLCDERGDARGCARRRAAWRSAATPAKDA